MTGKTDMVPVLNLPSHLSQPSQSENVPIFDRGTRCRFAPENHDFGENPGKKKENSQPRRTSRPLPAVLPPVGRCVASQGGREGTDTTRPILERVGELFGAPKKQQEKGVGSCPPHPGHFCPQCGQFHGVYHRGREMAFSVGGGVGNRKNPAVAEQLAGSQRNFKEENESDK